MTLANLRDQADDGGDRPQDSRAAKQESRVTRTEKPNNYCLDHRHDPRMVTESRFFYWDPADPSCPVCPVCQRQVNAQMVGCNAKGQPQIPAGLLALAGRLGEAV